MTNGLSDRIEYLRVDELFRGAPTVPLSSEVRRDMNEEQDRLILDPYMERFKEDWNTLGTQIVGGEGRHYNI